MTIIERVHSIIEQGCEMDGEGRATIEKMIRMAYYMGREEATREVADQYNAHLAEQRQRAESSRYHKMAENIIGQERYLYSPDYAQDITETFGSDPADI